MKIKSLVLTVALLSTVSAQSSDSSRKVILGGVEITQENAEQILKDQELSLLYLARKAITSEEVGTNSPCIFKQKLPLGITYEEHSGKTIREADESIVETANNAIKKGANPNAAIPFTDGKTFCDFAREMALRNEKFAPYKDLYLNHCSLDQFYKQFKRSCK